MKTAGFFQNKWRKRGFWAGIVVLVYALIGFLLVPWILGKVVPERLGKLLDREVTIEKIRINPFALSGSFQGLLIKDKDGTPLVSWDEVYGNFQSSSLLCWAWTFKEVRVISPYAHLQINPDYTLNIADILERFQSNSESAATSAETSIPAVRVESLQISNAVVQLSDLTLREPFQRKIGPTDLELRQFYTYSDEANPYTIEGRTEEGIQFAWKGGFTLFPLRSEGDLKVENVNIAKYAPMYRDFLSLTVLDGVVGASGHYRVLHSPTNQLLVLSNATFQLSSLKVRDDVSGTGNALEVGKLLVSGMDADLWQRSARIGSVTVNGGELTVRRNKDASINLVQMSQPSDTNAQASGAVRIAMQAATNLIHTFLGTSNQAIAVLDQLEVTNWALDLQDDVNRRPVRLRIDDIQVRGKNLSNIPGKDFDVSLACRWNTNGTVKVGGDASLFPLHSDVQVNVDRIELPPLDPYLEPFANVLLLGSKFSMDGVVKIRRENMEEPFDASFEGGLSLDDFSSVDGVMGSDLLEWKSVCLSNIQATLQPAEVSIGQILVQDSHATLVVESNRTINVLNAVELGDSNAPVKLPEFSLRKKPKASNEARPSENAQTFVAGDQITIQLPNITVPSVVISNANVALADFSTQPPLRFSVTGLNGQINGLSSTNLQRADLRISGKAGGNAKVEIAGKLNPLNSDAATDITIKLAGMDLSPFGPYSGRYAGYQLRKGKLSLDLQYNVAGRKLDSENLITVDQLSLGQKVNSPDATRLPVKLGVAILKDRNGVIELDVPIEGNLDDPEFRLGRVIGHTLMNMLTKMLASPFSLLGSLVGGSGEELSTFEFLPGQSDVIPAATNGLAKLSKALYERPGLEVEIQGSVDPERDGLAIRKQKLNRKLQQIRWEELRESAQAQTKPEDIALTPDIYTAALRKLFVTTFPDEARSSRPVLGQEPEFYDRMTRRLVEDIAVGADDYRVLAAKRAEAIRHYLEQRGGVESQRLFLVEGATETPTEGSKALLQLQ